MDTPCSPTLTDPLAGSSCERDEMNATPLPPDEPNPARVRLSRRAALLLTATALPLLAGCTRPGEDGDDRGAGEFGLTDWPDGAPTGPKVGDRAPNFRLPALAGGETTLSDSVATGRPVVLNVFATWCASCRTEMPVLGGAHGLSATVLGIDLREAPERVQPLVDATGARYPVLLDRDGAVARAYGTTGLPATCVIAADGTIRRWVVGPVTAASLADAIAAATG